MTGLTDGLLTVACILALACLGWWLMGRLLCPVPGSGTWVVLTGHSNGEGLEQKVRAFVWMRSLGLLRCPVVITDAGLDAQGREIALRLAARWHGVILCSADTLGEYIDRCN